MTITLVKYNDNIVRLVKYQRKVLFSSEPDWLLLQWPVNLPENKRFNKWVPLSTRFEWLKEFI